MKTLQEVYKALLDLTDEQLAMTVTASDGCDENGNAEFFPVEAFAVCSDEEIELDADASGLNLEQPVFMIGGDSESSKTYQDLKTALAELSAKQLGMTAMVAWGLSPHIIFHPIDAMTVAEGNDVAAAALNLFQPKQPILLFTEDPLEGRHAKIIKAKEGLDPSKAVLHLFSLMGDTQLDAAIAGLNKIPREV